MADSPALIAATEALAAEPGIGRTRAARLYAMKVLDAAGPLIAQAARKDEAARRLVSAAFACRSEDCPQPFALRRDHDVTGVSGTGTVAHGVQFADGKVVLRWLGDSPSTVIWDSLDAAMRVHGHDGKTRVVWLAAPFSEMGLAEQEAAAAERERIAALAEAEAARGAKTGLDRISLRAFAQRLREETT